MAFDTVGILAVILVVLPGAAGAQTADMERSALVVRIYNNYGISSQDLRTARDQAAAILRDAGIDVSWMDCGYKNKEAAAAPPSCRLPRTSNEVVLRIQATGPDAATRYLSMGFSLVSDTPKGDTPFFATVFADLVASIARRAGVDARQLLGYTFAHEIGHLLLNSSYHPDAGLMRAIWSRNELQRQRRSDWVFLTDEADTMRNAVAARTTLRP